MTNSMEGGIFDDGDFYKSHVANKDFNPKALKQIWKSINEKLPNMDTINKELLFEKYTFQMLNRCYQDWMK